MKAIAGPPAISTGRVNPYGSPYLHKLAPAVLI